MLATAAVVAVGKRHHKLDKRAGALREKERSRIAAWFRTFDVNRSGVLEREQLAALLKYLFPNEPPPSESALDLLMQRAIELDTTGDGKVDTKGISKMSVERVISKYMAFVNDEKFVTQCFDKFDTNKSGVLERDQLTALLDKLAPSCHPTEEDVDFVLQQCSHGVTGAVAREELLAAVALWKSIAVAKNPTACNCACVVA